MLHRPLQVLGLPWHHEGSLWVCGPLAFPVEAEGGGWAVRLGTPRADPTYDTLAEAMYWSVWHKASAIARLELELEEWKAALAAWKRPKKQLGMWDQPTKKGRKRKYWSEPERN